MKPPYVAQKSVGLRYSNYSLYGRRTSMFVLNKALWNDFKLFQVVVPFWFPKHKTVWYEMPLYILYPVVVWDPICKDQQGCKKAKKISWPKQVFLVDRNYNKFLFVAFLWNRATL